MTSGFLDVYSNWYGNSDFKGMMSGNPLDITDQLCVAAEPDDGWDAFIDTGKTQEWTSKFFKAHVIAFDGRDSPNFDFPNAETKPRYTYMIGPKKLKAVKETYGEDSWQWFSQCVGKPNKGLLLWRVITSAMCQKNNAHDSVVWRGDDALTTIYASDPAYGGGDRCVAGRVQFGINKDGVQILRVHPPEIIPINLRLKEEPEEQIARLFASVQWSWISRHRIAFMIHLEGEHLVIILPRNLVNLRPFQWTPVPHQRRDQFDLIYSSRTKTEGSD